MTDETALFRAVLADPDDDTVRLVYADWLEENGRADRAEFIRVQVRVAWGQGRGCTPACSHECGHAADCDYGRERELWLANYNLFTLEGNSGLDLPHSTAGSCSVQYLPQSREPGVLLMWKRGFVDEVRLPSALFLGSKCGHCSGHSGLAKELFERHPVRKVVLSDREPRQIPAFITRDGREKWAWDVDSRDMESPSTLPAVIWQNGVYDTRQDAIDWLSAALVTHGRREAGIMDPCDHNSTGGSSRL